jgi:hypothetical protein
VPNFKECLLYLVKNLAEERYEIIGLQARATYSIMVKEYGGIHHLVDSALKYIELEVLQLQNTRITPAS